MATCDQFIGGTVSYPCSLPKEHAGPHYAVENARSGRERQRWEDAQRANDILAQTQGPPQTTAERYTDNPTPPPGQQAEAARLHEGSSLQVHQVDGPEVPVELIPEDSPPCSGSLEIGGEKHGCARGLGHDGLCSFPTAPPHPGDNPGPVIVNDWTMPVDLSQEQPIPQTADHDLIRDEAGATVSMQDLVIADVEQRKAIGMERYGTLLMPFNGRGAPRDLYEEILDAAVYMRQTLYETGVVANKIVDVRGELEVLLSPTHPVMVSLDDLIEKTASWR